MFDDKKEELIEIKGKIYKDMPPTNQDTESRRGEKKITPKQKMPITNICIVIFKNVNVFVPRLEDEYETMRRRGRGIFKDYILIFFVI